LKLLWVKSGGLVPPDTGGKIRSYQILRELSRRHQVSAALFYAAEKNDRHFELESQFERLILWPVSPEDRESLAGRAAYAWNYFSTKPHSVVRFCRPEMLKDLRRLVSQEKFDLIICDFVLAAPIIPWKADVPKVLFTHNVEATIWRRHFEVARNPVWKAVWWREYWTTVRMERKYARAADHVLTVSESDRSHFSKFCDPSRITAIPTGVDVDYFQPLPAAEEANNLVFTGSMNWLPNEDGITYFAEKILPKIRQTVPDVVLWVVGRNPSTSLQRLADGDSRIRVTGAVEDIRPYVGRGTVYIVPLRVGSGTRLKIFEAMAMGKAIVSTTIGAEGLPVTHGKNIILADDPEDFAKQVILLLGNKPLRSQLGSSARGLVEQHYSWARVAAECEAIFNRLIHEYAEKKSVKVHEATAGDFRDGFVMKSSNH
jgi:polysaccharide biosynthesis protein PslH